MGRVHVIIPARYGASRFPGKPLALLAGKPLVAHVIDRALRARGVDAVGVATDDDRIAAVARSCGVGAYLTGAAATGTDRVAEAARQIEPRPTIVVNLQGDEPLVEPGAIEAVIAAVSEPGVQMATLARPLGEGEWDRTQVVKVVCSRSGDALYFSRAAVPHRRAGGASALARAHVGMYAFREPFLQLFATLEPGRLEQEEALEQLRALEHGHPIRVVDTSYGGFGVDTPDDLERARAMLSGRASDERAQPERKGTPW